MLYNELPDEFDTAAIGYVYDAWKGVNVDKAQLSVACVNILGFGLYKLVGEPPIPKTATSNNVDVDSAFQMLMTAGDGKQAIDWATLLRTILPIVQIIIGGLVTPATA